MVVDRPPLGSRCELCGCGGITDGLHIDSPQDVTVIDRLAVLINGFALHGGNAGNRIPLAAAAILIDMVVAPGRLISGAVVEGRSGTVRMTDFQHTVRGRAEADSLRPDEGYL